MVINEKDVVKNVEAATVQGTRAAAPAKSGFRCPAGMRSLLALALTVAVSLAAVSPTASLAKPAVAPGQTVAMASLPAEAQRTEQLIHAGGPFPYSRDGVVFGNYEKRLERQPRGYYHEYTVPTPGARNRGARRIICGGAKPTEPEACFYTEDHYGSFRRIVK